MTGRILESPGSLVLLRRGWSIRRLWILSIIGVTGLALDASFHWIQTGTPWVIIFDGGDLSTGKMLISIPLYVFALSVTGHITFLTAFSLLTVLPKLFFSKAFVLDSNGKKMAPSVASLALARARNWVELKQGRAVKQMWVIALIGAAGLALDISFHWLQDGSPTKVLLNGFDDPRLLVKILALSAHGMFLGAFGLLLMLPKILFAGPIANILDTNKFVKSREMAKLPKASIGIRIKKF